MKQSSNISYLLQRFNENIAWLNIKWIDYLDLFDPDNIKLDLLNNSAPHFFYNLQHILFDDLILHISKITDKKKFIQKKTSKSLISKLIFFFCDLTRKNNNAKNADKNNFCFELLLKSTSSHFDDKNINSLYSLLKEMKRKTKKIEKWRNKSIGHYELKTYLGDITLPKPPKDDIQTIINDINRLMNIINIKIINTQWAFDEQIPNGHALSLIDKLERAKTYREIELLLLDNGISESPKEFFRKKLIQVK
jgi:hypothetical protein